MDMAILDGHVTTRDEDLTKVARAAHQLQGHTQQLQSNFARAQDSIRALGRICDEADASVLRSQAILNRSAKEMQVIHDRTREILANYYHNGSDGVGGPLPSWTR